METYLAPERDENLALARSPSSSTCAARLEASNGPATFAARRGARGLTARCAAFALLAILAQAAWLRFDRLSDLSGTFDECFCWKLTTFDYDQLWNRVALDNHPPLYFYLLRLWRSLFGGSLAALRVFSAVTGVAGVIAAYLFVRQSEAISPRNGRPRDFAAPLLAAGFMALSPFQIDWSRQVRMYALASTLALVSSWLLLKALSQTRPRWQLYGSYAIAATLLAYTHYFGLLLIAAQLLYAAGGVFRRGLRGANRLSTAAHVWCAFCAVGILWLPWLGEFLRHRDQVADSFWTGRFQWEQLATICYQIFAPCWSDLPQATSVAWAACAALLLFSIATLAFASGAARLCGLAVLVTFGAALATSRCSRNVLVPHYLIMCHALLVCAVAIVLARLPRGYRELAGIGAFLLLGATSFRYANRHEAQVACPGMLAAMCYLAGVRQDGEPVVVSNPVLHVVASAHAQDGESVLVVTEKAGFKYYHGTAAMRVDEYVSRKELRGMPAERLWVIDAANWYVGVSPLVLPDLWVDVAEEEFPDWGVLGSRIIVRRCERRPSKHFIPRL